ncbi:hypothetical protein ACFVWL_01620 [Microbacterium sp. NPDC058269]|uniref:hypothetical protein n=1 Tax=Microbacterium sp. NPDC058269 TaxID=3346414 RepID=UPI0036DA21C1
MSDLRLDPDNVRIRVTSPVDQTAILNYLYLNDDVDELAHDILRDGYIDNEIPVVVRDGHGIAVMEGNRRVSALKGLLKPADVPARESQLDRLLRRYPGQDVPNSIRVMVAPDREAVQPLLARLHTGKSKKPWAREQQATFYYAQYEGGKTVAELRQQYPVAPGLVTRFIRMGEMNVLLRKLRFDDDELRKWALGSLTMSAFEYSYSKQDIQQALGIAFTSDGLLTSKDITPGLRAGLLFLIEGYRSGVLSTRSPQLRASDPAHEAFAAQLTQIVAEADAAEAPTRGDVPPAPGRPSGSSAPPRGNASPKPGGDQSGGGSTPPAAPAPGEGGGPSTGGRPRPTRGQVKRRLDLTGIDYRKASPGLRRRYEELERLDLDWAPNATYDLLRTVLECTIKDFFERSGNNPLQERAQLGDCIREMLKYFDRTGPSPDSEMMKCLTSLNQRNRTRQDQFIGTAESLNHQNHSPNAWVEKADVHAGWDRMFPLLKRLLSELT